MTVISSRFASALDPADIFAEGGGVLGEMGDDGGGVDVDAAQLDHIVAASLEAGDAPEAERALSGQLRW